LLLDFPFTDASGLKRRPAIVLLDTGDIDVVVAPVTSRFHGSHYDVAISHWRAANLRLASFVRLHKATTVKKSLVRGKLGTLHQVDRRRTASVLDGMCRNLVVSLRL
jgi:mRNA interferase MazF